MLILIYRARQHAAHSGLPDFIQQQHVDPSNPVLISNQRNVISVAPARGKLKGRKTLPARSGTDNALPVTIGLLVSTIGDVNQALEVCGGVILLLYPYNLICGERWF